MTPEFIIYGLVCLCSVHDTRNIFLQHLSSKTHFVMLFAEFTFHIRIDLAV